jgi:hypothetical protein
MLPRLGAGSANHEEARVGHALSGAVEPQVSTRAGAGEPAHLHRVLREYVAYYNADRTHVARDKDSPATRPVLPPGSRPGHRAAEGRWTPPSLRQMRPLTF